MKEKSTNTDMRWWKRHKRELYKTKNEKNQQQPHHIVETRFALSDGQFISICIWIH